MLLGCQPECPSQVGHGAFSAFDSQTRVFSGYKSCYSESYSHSNLPIYSLCSLINDSMALPDFAGSWSNFAHYDPTRHIGTIFPNKSVQLSQLLSSIDSDIVLGDLATLVSHRGFVFFKIRTLTLSHRSRSPASPDSLQKSQQPQIYIDTL